MRLELVWQVALPGAQRRTAYRAAVCADGTLYALDSRGTISAVKATGDLAFTTTHPDVVGMTAVACASTGELLVWNGHDVVTLLPGETGELDLVDRQPFAGHVFRVVPAAEATLALALDEQGRGQIVRFSASGTEEVTRLEATRDPQAVVDGMIVYDSDSRRIGYVPGGQYQLHSFDEHGRLVALYPRADPSFRSLPSPAGLMPASPAPRDRVIAVHALPDGNLLTQVTRFSGAGSSEVRPQVVMEILDERFNLLATVEDYLGRLQGVSTDGSVFLTDIRLPAGRAVRARLTAAGD